WGPTARYAAVSGTCETRAGEAGRDVRGDLVGLPAADEAVGGAAGRLAGGSTAWHLHFARVCSSKIVGLPSSGSGKTTRGAGSPLGIWRGGGAGGAACGGGRLPR